MKTRKSGFSLPEILVVVAIIGVLLPVLIWFYNSNWLIFHRTAKQQGIQEEIRDCLNKMMLDVKSAYYIEKADNSSIVLYRFNGDTLNGKSIDTSAPPGLDYKPGELVKVEYVLGTDTITSKDGRYKTLTRNIGGKKRDEYLSLSDFKVVGLKPDSGTYKFANTTNIEEMAGISVYIKGEYEDASMKGKEQKLEIETKMFSEYLRNYLIYGYKNGPLFKEGGYFTNLQPFGKANYNGNQEF
ncbi:MAG: type II secretion system protein [Candidatus Wallbacteria bacterium]|nr:type II secretion system protein [Candidatus Wallbacteria bacterium]